MKKTIGLILMMMVLALSGCKEEIKNEPVIEVESNTDALVNFELSNEVSDFLLDKDIKYVDDSAGYIFISYTVNEDEEEMICINPDKEIQFTITGGYKDLGFSGKYDSQFLINYTLIGEDGALGSFDETGELLFTFGNIFYMQIAASDDMWSREVIYMGDGAFVYIEKETRDYGNQTMKLVRQDKDGTTVLFEFLSSNFGLFAGYIEGDSFMIHYSSEFVSARMARVSIEGTVLYDEPTQSGWVTFKGDNFVVSRTNAHTIFDLNNNITGSFSSFGSIYNIVDYDGYTVFTTSKDVCTVNDDGSFLCEIIEPEEDEEDILYTFEDGRKIVKSIGPNNYAIVELVDGEDRISLTSHTYIRNVIVENELIHVSGHSYTTYYYEVFDFEGNIVMEEDGFPGILIALKDDGNYIVNYCEPTPQVPFIMEDTNCVKEVDFDGNIIWELEDISLITTVDQFGDNLVIKSGNHQCDIFVGSYYNCSLVVVSFDGESRFDVNDEYKSVNSLYSEDDYIYIIAVEENVYGEYGLHGVIYKLDTSMNIVGDFEIAYMNDEYIYYLSEDSLVRYLYTK